MSIVEASVADVSKSSGKSLSKPKEGLCPDYDTCKNYMPRAYDCNIKRNLGLIRIINKFPCYNEMDSCQRV